MLGLGLGLNKTVGKAKPKNELAYNPSTWAEWTKSADVTTDATGVEFTLGGYVAITKECVIKANTKYCLLLHVVSNAMEANNIVTTSITGYSIIIASKGTIGDVKVVVTSSSTNNDKFEIKRYEEVDDGLKIKMKDIRLYECPVGSQIAWDADNLTADQLNAKYPF